MLYIKDQNTLVKKVIFKNIKDYDNFICIYNMIKRLNHKIYVNTNIVK